MSLQIELVDWDERGLDLLRRMNTPAQKRYLGGPETEEKTLDRHARYLGYRQPGHTEMLMISHAGELLGSVGYWPHQRPEGFAYEAGWEILESFHGLGVGTAAATEMLSRLRPIARHRYVFAFPSPDNAGSNGLCARLGFQLIGTEDFEYPKGTVSPHNVWRLDLSSFASPV